MYILAIDQGTTSTRAIIFDRDGLSVSRHQIPLQQHYPELGWVEHDPEEIITAVIRCCQSALSKAHIDSREIAAIGITNQRETTVMWNRHTGQAIHPAIVWQDRRTVDICKNLAQQGKDTLVRDKTGLLLDPYFSATKIMWLLQHVAGAREQAQRGELAFGTIDSFILWRLTGGKIHATDATNASRTLLFNIHNQTWDQELLQFFQVPESLLPEVFDNCADYGTTAADIFGTPVAITAMAGDQHAALVGQVCFHPGMVKSTYGTGCFLVLNTGNKIVKSKHRLLTTLAYRINQQTNYAMEGSIFAAGTSILWLQNNLKLFADARDTELLARSISDNGGVYLVPAFVGLGAPYWKPNACAAIFGITRDTQSAHLARAALEAVCYQTRDLLETMVKDGAMPVANLRVDGGMVTNNWLMQFLADMLAIPVERTKFEESTAQGIAYLAGLQVGLFTSLEALEKLWERERQFVPKMSQSLRAEMYQGWLKAVAKV